jgi:hypothetical protein
VWGSGEIASRIVNLCTIWRLVIRFTIRPLHPSEKEHGCAPELVSTFSSREISPTSPGIKPRFPSRPAHSHSHCIDGAVSLLVVLPCSSGIVLAKQMGSHLCWRDCCTHRGMITRVAGFISEYNLPELFNHILRNSFIQPYAVFIAYGPLFTIHSFHSTKF